MGDVVDVGDQVVAFTLQEVVQLHVSDWEWCTIHHAINHRVTQSLEVHRVATTTNPRWVHCRELTDVVEWIGKGLVVIDGVEVHLKRLAIITTQVDVDHTLGGEYVNAQFTRCRTVSGVDQWELSEDLTVENLEHQR
ncbi:hypothetical protein D3C80_1548810 [compost metagenome]